MFPIIFQNRPIHDKYVLVELTYFDKDIGEKAPLPQVVPLSMLLVKEYAYRAGKQRGRDVAEWLNGNVTCYYKAVLFNTAADKFYEKEISIDEDGKLYIAVVDSRKKRRLFLDDFTDGVSEDFINQNGELTLKIIRDTLNYSSILLEKAQSVAKKKYQNSSIIVTDIEFDTEKEEVYVTTRYRSGKGRVMYRSFPFSELCED